MPRFDQNIEVTAKRVPQGSCVSDEMMGIIAASLVVTSDEDKTENEGMRVADESDNLSALGSDGGLYTKAVVAFSDDQPWLSGVTSEIIFTGWPTLIDATQSSFHLWFIPNTAERGVEVKKEPTGVAFIRPTIEVSHLSKDKIKVKMFNTSLDAQVYLRIEQVPLAPEQPR